MASDRPALVCTSDVIKLHPCCRHENVMGAIGQRLIDSIRADYLLPHSGMLFREPRMLCEDYPFLFAAADAASIRKQRLYFRLIQTEYALLLTAAVLSMNFFQKREYYELSALIFVALLIVLLSRSLLKPEQDWFRCRALAEALKTLTWRYMMRAQPFELCAADAHEAAFRDKLQEVLNENISVAALTYHDEATGDYATEEIRRVRAADFETRRAYYRDARVQQQREWYAGRAAQNRNSSTGWVVATAAAYVIAATLVLARTKVDPTNLPIEPMIVLASSLVGWMQVRKFNELSASYTITAHEIGLLKAKLGFIHDDAALATFVAEAELSFSREHTLWFGRSLS
ncbi:MAG: DUF4231 domain-containing protein [Sphingomonas sp.]|nr:DUF4231 domain-containing protein [Sphingomonas sp.]